MSEVFPGSVEGGGDKLPPTGVATDAGKQADPSPQFDNASGSAQ